ncbi:MAG: hypothetical protein IJM99_06155, partial [Firmicutes bacterium]|nr:hypothetical protein [Bacillota bacterium]
TDFSNDKVKELMKAIRIIFFNPLTGDIYVKGGLDTASATVGADGVTAEMYLYTGDAESNSTTWIKVTDGTGTHKQNVEYVPLGQNEQYSGTKYVSDGAGGYVKATGETVGTHKMVVTYVALTPEEMASYTGDRYKETTAGATKKTDDVIMPLVQNTQTALSVLVYLDGNNMGNDDVAATASTSMTGKMNLQFASSATLVPMEYADLHIGGNSTPTLGDNEVAVTVPEGVTGAAKATKNTAYTFTVDTGYTLNSVTVGGTAVTPTDNTGGSYTIPADQVTGAIVINVTAPASGE